MNSKTVFYLDSCIFVAYFYPEDKNHKHIKTKRFIEKVANSNLELVSSHFALTETVSSLSSKPELEEIDIVKYATKLARIRRLGKCKFKWIKMDEEYDYDNFFYDIQEKLLQHRVGLGDTIHIVIMENKGINNIITFNATDFSKFDGINVIEPDDIDRYM